MAETKLARWLAAIDKEAASPQPDLNICPEDRLYRLYPQHLDRVRQIPLTMASLLQEGQHELLLRRVYQHILLRDPDPAGYAHHLERLRSKAISPFDLIMEFRLSAEGRKARRRIKGLWSYCLLYLLRPYLPQRLLYNNKLIGLRLEER